METLPFFQTINEKGTQIEKWMKYSLAFSVITALATVIGLFIKSKR